MTQKEKFYQVESMSHTYDWLLTNEDVYNENQIRFLNLYKNIHES